MISAETTFFVRFTLWLIAIIVFSIAQRGNSSPALVSLVCICVASAAMLFTWLANVEKGFIRKLERICSDPKRVGSIKDALNTRYYAGPPWLICMCITLTCSVITYLLLISVQAPSKPLILLLVVVMGFIGAYGSVSYHAAHVVQLSEGAAIKIVRALEGDDDPNGPGVWEESSHIIG